MTEADAKTRSRLAAEVGRPDRPRLAVVWEGGAEAVSVPERGTLVVGRGLDCDLRVINDSVSRRHVAVHSGPGITIEDLGSSNGTRLDGRRLTPGQRVPLSPGQVVELGDAVLILQGAAFGREPAAPVADGDDAMERLYRLIDLVASGGVNVVLQGETGVGKEVVAQRIHDRSPRAGRPFVRINCAAFPESMVEAELFGYEKGAFTGAARAKQGLLEAASGSTLLLDEVAELPITTQAKLLRAVGNGEVLRIGALEPRVVDVRFIAATHKPLTALVGEGKFRADLYFRLNGMTISIPPLRERRNEIVPLARAFIAEAAARAGRQPPPLSPEALAWMVEQRWPGNVRELRAAVERAVLLAGAGAIRPAHLHPGHDALPAEEPGQSAVLVAEPFAPTGNEAGNLAEAVERLERERITSVLAQCAGNQTKAAKLLGISRRMLLHRLDLYGLPRPRKGR